MDSEAPKVEASPGDIEIGEPGSMSSAKLGEFQPIRVPTQNEQIAPEKKFERVD